MFEIDKIDRGTELFILDIYIAILKIRKVASKFENVQDLLHSFTDWDSVIREFEIIGEASKYLLRDRLISKDYQVIVDFRNQISHGYFGIDQDTVWLVIHSDLKDLQNIIVELINNLEDKEELINAFIEDNKYLDFIVEALEELK